MKPSQASVRLHQGAPHLLALSRNEEPSTGGKRARRTGLDQQALALKERAVQGWPRL